MKFSKLFAIAVLFALFVLPATVVADEGGIGKAMDKTTSALDSASSSVKDAKSAVGSVSEKASGTADDAESAAKSTKEGAEATADAAAADAKKSRAKMVDEATTTTK